MPEDCTETDNPNKPFLLKRRLQITSDKYGRTTIKSPTPTRRHNGGAAFFYLITVSPLTKCPNGETETKGARRPNR